MTRLWCDRNSGLHCVFAQREECLALSLTSSLEPSVVLTESTLLGLVDHSEHTSNVLAHHLDLGQLRGSTPSHLRHTQVGELGLELIELLGEVSLGLGLLPQLVALHLRHDCC